MKKRMAHYTSGRDGNKPAKPPVVAKEEPKSGAPDETAKPGELKSDVSGATTTTSS